MPSARDIARAAERGPVLLAGATAPYAAYLGAAIAARRTIVLVVPDESVGRAAVDDLAFFGVAATFLPAPDGSPYAELQVDRVAEATRLGVLYLLARGGPEAPRALVTTAGALVRRTLPADELLARSLEVERGATVPRDATAARLVEAGFARTPIVEDAGTFAVRGNVIDIGAPLLPYPVRLELDGDLVESIRLFDPSSQRTLREIDRVLLHPVRAAVPSGAVDWKTRIRDMADAAHHPSSATRRLLEQIATGDVIGIDVYGPAFHAAMVPLWSYVPADAAWLWWDPDATLAIVDAELADAAGRHGERLAHRQISFPPEAHHVERADVLARLHHDPRRVVMPTLELTGDPRGTGATALRVAIDPLSTLRTELERARIQHADQLGAPLGRTLGAARRDGLAITLAADSAQRADRLVGLLEGFGLAAERAAAFAPDPELARVVIAPLSASFASRDDGLLVLGAGDVFGARRAAPRTRSAAKRAKDALLGGVGDFSQLAIGDYLVHQLHGVGRYRGLAKLAVGATIIDFLHLEYDGGTLYLPVFRLGEVQRYVGAEGHAPRLDKLGGLTWDKAKTKVSRQVAALAEELLQLYAQRAALPGHRFPPADDFFREFEAGFPFEETPDQAAAIEATLADMESARAMDRLICGDVGYGKTEVALRAIFKAAMAGKQALLLAPTTILVEQHARTMTERFASWPIRVGKLSRFQSKSQQLATLHQLAAGGLDVVVGTHRALSADVRWKDLGLVVIDEEQRFGVTHKERLKKLRAHVDVLTLTATPIPRTLHLALTGLRDLSIIATPPADRRAVRTFVAQLDEALVKSAIEQELARGGQIYFVSRHIDRPPAAPGDGPRPVTSRNDRSLAEWADLIRRLVPKARVGIAHGAMAAEELEDAMVKFVGGEVDVLVSTTIVESGLDIPRANTLFVARADAFGLAQLYQLRGRVGRSSARAYCYLLVPSPDQLTDDARRRLEALQRFTELGAGFQIASADLEIRGGGELLGARQSGSIAAVGFEQYVRMLEEAVAQMKGEPIHHPIDPELQVEVPGYIPDDYVPDPGQRLDLYKRLSAIEDEDEARALLDELADRFGPLPGETLLLADLMIVKALARRLAATAVELTRVRVALALGATTPVDPRKLPRPWRLERDGRLHAHLSPDEAKSPTAAARQRLQELVARVS